MNPSVLLKQLETSMMQMDPEKFSEIHDQYLKFMHSQMQERGTVNPMPMSAFFPSVPQTEETIYDKPITEKSFNINPLSGLRVSQGAKRRYTYEDEEESLYDRMPTYSPNNASFNDDPLISSPPPEVKQNIEKTLKSLNLEEIPLSNAPRDFEELLQEQLRTDNYQTAGYSQPQKRQFLKRKTQVNAIPKAKTSVEEDKRSLCEDTAGHKPKANFLKKGDGKLCQKPSGSNKTLKNKTPEVKHKEPEFIMKTEEKTREPEFKTKKIEPKRSAVEAPRDPELNTPTVRLKPKQTKKEEDTIDYDSSALEITDIPAVLKEKLDKLNSEITRFKTETQHIRTVTKDLDTKKKELEIEYHSFQETKQQDFQQLEQWKDQQMKHLKLERKKIEESIRTKADVRKDTGELDELKHTLSTLQDELKTTDNAQRETLEQLKSQLENINAENSQLEFELKQLEQLRIKNAFKTKEKPQEIVFKNGAKKKVYPDGRIVITFPNGDVKEALADGTIIYNFYEDQTTQTTFPDGQQLFEFANGQTERHFPDGSKEIMFSDGTSHKIPA